MLFMKTTLAGWSEHPGQFYPLHHLLDWPRRSSKNFQTCWYAWLLKTGDRIDKSLIIWNESFGNILELGTSALHNILQRAVCTADSWSMLQAVQGMLGTSDPTRFADSLSIHEILTTPWQTPIDDDPTSSQVPTLLWYGDGAPGGVAEKFVPTSKDATTGSWPYY